MLHTFVIQNGGPITIFRKEYLCCLQLTVGIPGSIPTSGEDKQHVQIDHAG